MKITIIALTIAVAFAAGEKYGQSQQYGASFWEADCEDVWGTECVCDEKIGACFKNDFVERRLTSVRRNAQDVGLTGGWIPKFAYEQAPQVIERPVYAPQYYPQVPHYIPQQPHYYPQTSFVEPAQVYYVEP